MFPGDELFTSELEGRSQEAERAGTVGTAGTVAASQDLQPSPGSPSSIFSFIFIKKVRLRTLLSYFNGGELDKNTDGKTETATTQQPVLSCKLKAGLPTTPSLIYIHFNLIILYKTYFDSISSFFLELTWSRSQSPPRAMQDCT